MFTFIYLSITHQTPRNLSLSPLSTHLYTAPPSRPPTLPTYHEEFRGLPMSIRGRINQSGPANRILRLYVRPFFLGDRRTQPWRGRRQTGARGTRRRRTGREETVIGMKRDEYKRIRHIYIYTYIYIYIKKYV